MWLLRIAVAVTLLFNAPTIAACLSIDLVAPGLVLVAAALVIGILTPVMSALVFLLSCVVLFQSDPADVSFSVLSALNAIVLFLLGPGAYSLDARLYGRRVVVLTDSEAGNID